MPNYHGLQPFKPSLLKWIVAVQRAFAFLQLFAHIVARLATQKRGKKRDGAQTVLMLVSVMAVVVLAAVTVVVFAAAIVVVAVTVVVLVIVVVVVVVDVLVTHANCHVSLATSPGPVTPPNTRSLLPSATAAT